MISSLQRILPALCLACLANTARAEEQLTPIRDDAGLFHADAIARAEPRIDDIRRTFDRNLLVRTVPSIAPHERRRFLFLKTPQVNRILEEQAQKIADQSGVNGIYVVICKAPRDVHVVVRPEDDPLFGQHDAEALRRTIVRNLHDGSDQTLFALIEQVRSTLQTHTTHGPSTSAVSAFTLLALLAGGSVLWLLLSIVRYKLRAIHPTEEGAAEQARRTSALLGAMFGFPSGQWIYDKLCPCSTGSSEPPCEPETPAAAVGETTEKADVEEHPEDAPMVP